MKKVSLGHAAQGVIPLLLNSFEYFRFRFGAHRRLRSTVSSELPSAVINVLESGERAFAKYRPKYYPGRVIFIKAKESLRLPDDPNLVWEKLLGGIEVQVIPGDHRAIVSKYNGSLADCLSRCIENAEKMPGPAAS